MPMINWTADQAEGVRQMFFDRMEYLATSRDRAALRKDSDEVRLLSQFLDDVRELARMLEAAYATTEGDTIMFSVEHIPEEGQWEISDGPQVVGTASTEPHARLFASAPKLLAALKELVHYDDGSSEQGSFGYEVLGRCKSVIANAEGRTE